MKRVFIALFLIIFAASCSMEETLEPVTGTQALLLIPDDAIAVFNASTECDPEPASGQGGQSAPGSKATADSEMLSGRTAFIWQDSDEVAAFSGTYRYRAVIASCADSTATFYVTADETQVEHSTYDSYDEYSDMVDLSDDVVRRDTDGDLQYAVFPYAATRMGENTVTYPAVYENYESGKVLSPMMAIMPEKCLSERDGRQILEYPGVRFLHLGSTIELTLSNLSTGTDAIEFQTNDNTPINGVYAVKSGVTADDIKDSSWYTKASETSDCTKFTFTPIDRYDESHRMVFYVPVPPGVIFSGFTVSVFVGGAKVKEQSFTFDTEKSLPRASMLTNANVDANEGFTYIWTRSLGDRNLTGSVDGTGEQVLESDFGPYGASPALSPDGKYVYVTANDYNLTGLYASTGNYAWNTVAQDDDGIRYLHGHINLDPDDYVPNKLANIDGVKNALTPSVDEDGYIYVTGFEELDGSYHTCLYKITPGEYAVASEIPKKKVTLAKINGANQQMSVFHYGSPVHVLHNNKKYVVVAAKNWTAGENMGGGSGHVLFYENDDSGMTPLVGLHANSGSFGSPAVLSDGVVLASTGGASGHRVYYPNNDKWIWKGGSISVTGSLSNTGDTSGNLTGYAPYGASIAIDRNGTTVYTLGMESGVATLYRYDNVTAANAAAGSFTPTKKWTLSGTFDENCAGGVVIGENGWIYASVPDITVAADTTTYNGEGYIFGVNPASASSTYSWIYNIDMRGTPAVGNDGHVYAIDCSGSSVVKINGMTGVHMGSMSLNAEPGTMMCSPAIGPTGHIYISGKYKNFTEPTHGDNGRLVVFCVHSTASAPANSWSQMGGHWTRAGRYIPLEQVGLSGLGSSSVWVDGTLTNK